MSTNAIALSLPAPAETTERHRARPTDRARYVPEDSPADNPPAEPVQESNPTADEPSDDATDLQQVKGIGRKTVQALRDCGIHHCADLASFTPERLADLLKTRIPSISSKRIERENWLGQARMLAQGQAEFELAQMEADETPALSAEDQREGPIPSHHKGLGWRELADFFVSFGFEIDADGAEHLKTKAHHSQSDTSETWDGIVSEELIAWMMDQAHLPLPPETEPQERREPATQPSAPPASGMPQYDARIEVAGVDVLTIPTPLDRQKVKLAAEVHFRLSGSAARELASARGPFRVELYTVDLGTGASKSVASAMGQLQPKILDYASRQEFPVPRLGRYELQAVVRLLPPGDGMACHRGPTISVVP